MGWDILISAAIAVLVPWLALLIGLAAAVRPKGPLIKGAMRILPDLLRRLTSGKDAPDTGQHC